MIIKGVYKTSQSDVNDMEVERKNPLVTDIEVKGEKTTAKCSLTLCK